MIRPNTWTVALLMLLPALWMIPAEASHCGTPPESTHTYGSAGSVSVTTVLTGKVGAGATVVSDGNAACDADGDGVPGDFDGDYEFGVGGAYFGAAGHEQVNVDCGLGLHLHASSTVVVQDALTPVVAFSAGYEGWDGSSETYCENDGIIGDDAEDCLGSAWESVLADPCAGHDAVGLNMDAGLWLFVECHISDAPAAECATAGTAWMDAGAPAGCSGAASEVEASFATQGVFKDPDCRWLNVQVKRGGPVKVTMYPSGRTYHVSSFAILPWHSFKGGYDDRFAEIEIPSGAKVRFWQN